MYTIIRIFNSQLVKCFFVTFPESNNTFYKMRETVSTFYALFKIVMIFLSGDISDCTDSRSYRGAV